MHLLFSSKEVGISSTLAIPYLAQMGKQGTSRGPPSRRQHSVTASPQGNKGSGTRLVGGHLLTAVSLAADRDKPTQPGGAEHAAGPGRKSQPSRSNREKIQ